jgi:hypothetical protein
LDIRTIDIAHPPMKSDEVENFLEEELQKIRLTGKQCILKIVHGYGSNDKPGILKEVVRNWAYRNRKRLSAVIPGEEYDIFDKKTVKMRKEYGQISDPDLGSGNPGITLIWIS